MSDETVQSAIESNPKTKRGGIFFRLMKWCFVVCFVMCLAVVLYVLIDALPFGGVTISPETTRITSPLTPDGKSVDYRQFFLEQAPKNIATDDNGFRVVAREFGSALLDERPDEEKACWVPICKALALDPEQKPNIHFVDWYTNYRDYLASQYPGDENKEIRSKKNGSVCELWHSGELVTNTESEAYPVMLKWLKEVDPALDIIAREVKKDLFVFPCLAVEYPDTRPLLFDLSVKSTFFSQFRYWARAFRLRADYRLTQGDFDGAIADREAARRLGYHVCSQYPASLISNLVGTAISSDGMCFRLRQFPNVNLTKEQWQRLADFERHMPIVADLKHAIDFDNYMGLDMYQATANGKTDNISVLKETSFTEGFDQSPKVSFLRAWAEKSLLDWDVIMKDLNKKCDLAQEEWPPEKDDTNLLFERADHCLLSWSGLRSVLTEDTRSRYVAWRLHNSSFPFSAFKEANRRIQCSYQLQAIDLAFQLYRADHGTYPPCCTVDAKGKPLHSWRVLILPYLGQEELYKKIKLDEPWDSEHNRQLHRANVPFYQCPSRLLRTSSTPVGQHWDKVGLLNETDAGQTTYSVIVGPDTLFPKPGVGIDPLTLYKADPKRDIEKMILVTERVDTICWMKPDDELTQELALSEGISHKSDRKLPSPTQHGIASNHRCGAQAGLCNGTVMFFSALLNQAGIERCVKGTSPE
ncbi:MAG: DUF1559 domain-containing protein [Planctomycetia bacterium]|nr:DUF1559 domain-containing protein [Planctomycetia bacterium]